MQASLRRCTCDFRKRPEPSCNSQTRRPRGRTIPISRRSTFSSQSWRRGMTLAPRCSARGIDSSELRREIARASAAGLGDGTSRAKSIVEEAIKVAQELNYTEVDSAHLLFSLLNDQTSLACRTLVGLGANLDQLRSEILERLPPGSASELAHRKSLEVRLQNHPRASTQAAHRTVARRT